MTVDILYLIMGIMMGMLLKHELDMRARRKRLNKRMSYIRTTANDNTIEQYDEILSSIRSLNDSLKQKKEV